jgi:hypothetical protein
MGNILNPSPGDLVDRQTILQIKLEHCDKDTNTGHRPTAEQAVEQSPDKLVSRTKMLGKSKINVQPFIIENNAIQDRLMMDWLSKLNPVEGDQYDSFFDQLKEVNSDLWDYEDQARVYRSAPASSTQLVIRRKAELLDNITTANDKRAELVKKINKLWGIELLEKLY